MWFRIMLARTSLCAFESAAGRRLGGVLRNPTRRSELVVWFRIMLTRTSLCAAESAGAEARWCALKSCSTNFVVCFRIGWIGANLHCVLPNRAVGLNLFVCFRISWSEGSMVCFRIKPRREPRCVLPNQTWVQTSLCAPESVGTDAGGVFPNQAAGRKPRCVLPNHAGANLVVCSQIMQAAEWWCASESAGRNLFVWFQIQLGGVVPNRAGHNLFVWFPNPAWWCVSKSTQIDADSLLSIKR